MERFGASVELKSESAADIIIHFVDEIEAGNITYIGLNSAAFNQNKNLKMYTKKCKTML